MKKGDPNGPALFQISIGLLVVLPIQEARDVDRFTLEARLGLLILVVELRLGRAAGDVRHALEQCSTTGGWMSLRIILVLRRGDRRGADRARQDVVGAEEQLV